MHLLATTSVTLDEANEAVDVAQSPGDVVVLSFADSDLALVAAAHARLAHARSGSDFPSLRLADLKRLRHPLSVDLYVDQVAAKARFVLVRCLGGVDYWRYGLERLSQLARETGLMLAAVPGEPRPDPALMALSSASPDLLRALHADFSAGSEAAMQAMLGRIAAALGHEATGETTPAVPAPLPPLVAWSAEGGAMEPEAALASLPADRPVVPLLFYRSALAAGDVAPVAALAETLAVRGLAPLPLALTSLKDPAVAEPLRRLVALRPPAVIVALTGFSARDDAGFVLDTARVPVIQAIVSGSTREAWAEAPAGLAAADLAMQVVLPEADGRLIGRAVAFKEWALDVPAADFVGRRKVADPEGVAAVANLAARWARLAATPRGERRLAFVLSDYPARAGRAGYAVGLDTPASLCAIFDDLAAVGFDTRRSFDVADVMPRLTGAVPPSPRLRGEGARGHPVAAADLSRDSAAPGEALLSLADYRAWFSALPAALQAEVLDRWGAPESDPACRDGHFVFPVLRAGKALAALQPGRGLPDADRKALHHAPDVPPCHGYLAFYLALRRSGVDALVHLGTHGTMEWLPGKAVALSGACWPQVVTGDLPVIYPFIVNDPGEAAPAKRRIAALTLGHLTPPLAIGGLHGEAAGLRDLVEEYAGAQVLDPRRATLLAEDILSRAEAAGLAAECGIVPGMGMAEALSALDAHLCDLAEVSFAAGLHVFGRSPAAPERARLLAEIAGLDEPEAARVAEAVAASGAAERDALVAALDGRFVPPGPSGSPARGQVEVLPTGRNMTTLDPRAVPTRAAVRLGERAAAEVIRRHLQETGDWPRRIVMDLWASPTMRTGGEDIAHALALMGAKPEWDHASGRVGGFTILPLALLDRPRVDVTLRVSGAFRDTFPVQLALLDQAARAVAALDEEDGWNPLAAARRAGGLLSRVFGAAPGRYGMGLADRVLADDEAARTDLAALYLAATDHAYGAGEARADDSFAERLAAADAFVHVSDTRERDILDGDDAMEAIGGFAVAGRDGALVFSLDTSRPKAPRVRTVEEDVARLVRGRLINPRWIAGQLAHGWRGAAELAQSLDAVFICAATTGAVSDHQFDMLFSAYVGDEAVFAQVREANPPAAGAILERFAAARRRGLWRSRLNSAATRLETLVREAAA
ncbi:Cobalamin biosynthesis protein CobN, Mg-chelatase [Chelatococcus sambhunathii]|uniref:Cobalamin biosynthesis protein CobN, Mg-chelatase n=1 Tax=Chelatococcus sambhunathii TaxID=363953 RepID=A0ABM9U726_9HYPH|nr:cobaltochelatase subunit CobN [Chelatococcus sambhunathii]CUA88995.1 Cobalamin biosynthesis protein CobN, Mg-chelatase [Chelatococcus sambhunathii]